MKSIAFSIFTAAAVTVFLGSPAVAQEFVFGAGVTEFSASDGADSAIAQLEWHPSRNWSLLGGDLGPGVGLAAHGTGDVWLGAGLSWRNDFGGGWFAEASFMPGVYEPGRSVNDLGSNLEFRSLLGIGRGAFSIAVSHLSNGGTGRTNPGADALTLRWRRGY